MQALLLAFDANFLDFFLFLMLKFGQISLLLDLL